MQFSLWNLRLLYTTLLLQTTVSAHNLTPRRNIFPSWKKSSLVFMTNVYLCVRLFILEYASIHVACTFLKPQWLKFHSWTYPAFPYTYLLCTACVRSFRLFIGISPDWTFGSFYDKIKCLIFFSRWKSIPSGSYGLRTVACKRKVVYLVPQRELHLRIRRMTWTGIATGICLSCLPIATEVTKHNKHACQCFAV